MKKLVQPFDVGTGTGTKAYEVGEGNSATSTTLRDIAVANTTAGDLTFTCHVVPSGLTVVDANMLFPAVNIPANKILQWEGSYEMDSGDFIQAIASGAGLTMHINGEEDKR